MATASPAERPAPSRRAFRPRFSLAAAPIAMTLCAVGLWYWYRVPFVVEQLKPPTAGSFSKSTATGRPKWPPDPAIKETETLRRVWGGTVRHGPRHIYRNEILTRLESYQEGVRHGRWEWWTDAGELYLAVEFERGNAVAIQPGKDCDKRLAELLVNDAIDQPQILRAILQNTKIDFVNTPLKDGLTILQDQHGVPILFDAQLERSVLDTPFTAELGDVPLIVVLGRMLQPAGLVCDYRYGVLWITRPELAGQERTGVSKLVPPPDSTLAEVWEQGSMIDFIEVPPQTALSFLSAQTRNRAAFDLSPLPPEFIAGHMPGSSVTLSVAGVPFKHSLAILLDRLGCQARLNGETIVVELQPPEASDAP